ncbi:MAG: ECF transporter S component [Tissierellales bacterium]|nr:ECF transporter S component [Tissierellales bacterium]
MNSIFSETRKLTFLGMMVAITVILGYTPLGFIMIPPVSITLTHLPTIITSIILGPLAGLIIGASMGVVSLLRAITAASPIDKLFIDPRLSILPRLFIGPLTFYAYTFFKSVFKSKDNKISIFLGSITGSLVNTIGVLGMLYIIYASRVIEELGVTIKTIVIGAISINIVIEMIAAGIICTPIIIAVNKYLKSH